MSPELDQMLVLGAIGVAVGLFRRAFRPEVYKVGRLRWRLLRAGKAEEGEALAALIERFG